MLDLNGIARDVRNWQDKNFNPTPIEQTLVVCEEAGEVARAVVKGRHGIRSGTRGNVADEIGDLIMVAAALADRFDIDVEEAIQKRLKRTLSLDFTKDPETGGE